MPSLLQKLIEFVSTDRTDYANDKGSQSQSGVNFITGKFLSVAIYNPYDCVRYRQTLVF